MKVKLLFIIRPLITLCSVVFLSFIFCTGVSTLFHIISTNMASTVDLKAELKDSLYQQQQIKSEPTIIFSSQSLHTMNEASKKPSLSYIGLISLAIQSSPRRRMLLSEIYQWIVNNFPYFKMEDRSWRNSIRHNLSLNECFIKCGRSENGKSHYWSIHPANMHCFSTGDFRRRHARQLVRKCDEDLERLCNISPAPTHQTPYCKFEGYVPMSSQRLSRESIKEMFGEEVLRTIPRKQYDKCELGTIDMPYP